MSDHAYPFSEDHNYLVHLKREDGYEFDVIAAVIKESETDGKFTLCGIQPKWYRGDFPEGLFWASGSLGGPEGEARRGLYPSVTIKPSDPVEVRSIRPTNLKLKSELIKEGRR